MLALHYIVLFDFPPPKNQTFAPSLTRDINP